MLLILWIPLAVVGCAAFAALGIWAAVTDEGHTAQRRRAAEMQAILVPAQQAVFEARQRYRQRENLLLLAATYWLLGGKPHEVDPSIVQERMMHACEWETSMILHLAPGLVGALGTLEPVPSGMPFEPATQGWITRERSAPAMTTIRYLISSGALTPKIDSAEAKTRPTPATKASLEYDNFRLFSLTKRKSRVSFPLFQWAWKRVASSCAKNATRCGSWASAA